jgi:uncharacterized protein YukE
VTALTLEVVRGWRPGALADAAAGVEEARATVEAQVQAAKATMARLAERWEGEAAQAAAERIARESATGFELADALESARSALQAGAADLGSARDALLATVESVRSAGFTVADDGRVTAPTLPPVLTEVGDPTGAGARRDAEQRALNEQAADHAAQITAALEQVAATDVQVAGTLSAVPVPQTLSSAVDAYLQRAIDSGDVVGALGAVGAGGVALAQVIKKFVGTATKGTTYLNYLRAAFAPITDYQTMLRNFDAADDALRAFKNGPANGGVLRFVMGSRAAGLVGKAFLPVTIATGAVDVVTGGGYEGARGWATRGFALGGVAGAGTLLLAGSALGPVGVAVAGGAVLAYGAWSLGNMIWDNREAIGDFVSSAAGHVADAASTAWNATTGAVSDAVDWAGDTVRDAGENLRDLGKGALDVLSFGLL